MYDVIVVGAGPAGSATATFLARAGFKVAILERAAFPRPKPCAEYLSPEASRILDTLGVSEALESESPAHLHGMRIVSPSGREFTGRYRPSPGSPNRRDYGIALPREILDLRLARAAVANGVTLFEGTTLEQLGPVEAGRRILRLRTAAGPSIISARLVVGADGLNSRVARQLGLRQRGRLRRIAFVTHVTGIADMRNVGEMHVGRSGYVGLAPVGRGIINVAAVVDVCKKRCAGSPKEIIDQVLPQYPSVWDRFSGVRFVKPVTAVGPFACWSSRATANRTILVGDAADFYDPFTGEGIYSALRGAELAAGSIAPLLERDELNRSDLAPYDLARRRAFRGKWILERAIAWAITKPRLFDHITHRLAQKPRLADALVGVTGDVIPHSSVLSPSFAWQMVTPGTT
jgi:geranylgeranyl reductase family protein